MVTRLRHSDMLQVNEFLVLDFIRERGRTTRLELSSELRLSAASISRIVRRLVSGESIHEEPGESAGGRPATVLSYNSAAGCVIGVDLGGTKCQAALADLAGGMRAQEVCPILPEGPYPTLLGMIDRMSARARDLDLPVLSVAVGVPAILDPDSGFAVGGPNVHWDGFPLAAKLGTRLAVPFTVENDVNLAALAHAWRGNARGCANYVTLAIGTGIGAAVVLDGRLAKGRHNAAGEIGYLLLSREQVGGSSGRGLGGFERLASGPMIAANAAARAERAHGASVLSDGEVTPERVFAAAAAGDALAVDVIEELLDHIAMAVVALTAIADPEVIVLDGSIGRALSSYLQALERRVGRHLPFPPRIVASRLGSDASMLGAVAAALELVHRDRQPSAFFGSFEISRGRASSGDGLRS